MTTAAPLRPDSGAVSFPFGVAPEPPDEGGGRNGRGADTANRLLLHGARHHDRDALFQHWGQGRKGWNWQRTPDWRADRTTIRAALVLRQRARVEEGARVALWLPLGPSLAVLERAVWSIGAVSTPLWPEWPPARVAEVLFEATPAALFAPSLDALRELEALGGRPETVETAVCMLAPEASGDDWISYASFLEYGGVLDTPERASMLRALARKLTPSTPASLEYGADPVATDGAVPRERPREVDHRELVERAARITHALGTGRNRTRVLTTERPELFSRVLVLAAWADGLTRTAFAGCVMGREHVPDLRPELVACRSQDAEFWLGVLDGLGGPEAEESSERARGWRGKLKLPISRDGEPRAARRVRRLIVLDGDASPTWKRAADGVEILAAAELWSEPPRFGDEVAQPGRMERGARGA